MMGLVLEIKVFSEISHISGRHLINSSFCINSGTSVCSEVTNSASKVTLLSLILGTEGGDVPHCNEKGESNEQGMNPTDQVN